MAVTFVTAYLKVYEEAFEISRTFENRLKFFILLLDLGINICIFVEPELKNYFDELETKYNNLKVMKYITIEELELYQLGNECPESKNLPENRHCQKDTDKYMFLMLAKLEFLQKTIIENPYCTDYFCWFDFSLPYIFKDMDNTLLKIKHISNYPFKDTFIYVPGCWNWKINNINCLKNVIVWRFCGGFLLGDKDTILDFYTKSDENFVHFLKESNTLVWEVNYWAWLEGNGLINPIWYLANHDDTIINIPNIDVSEILQQSQPPPS